MKTKSAADFFGSKKKLAEALGISPSAVTMWGDDVPELRQYQIERLTRGKVKRGAATETTVLSTTAAVS
ncbi:Cro/CI family transcriptional regulator [Pseudomonas chengduensis]